MSSIILNSSGDIEQNPGPRPVSSESFSICHWKLDSVFADRFIKTSLLKAYIFVKRFDIICLPEKYLDSISDGDNLMIEGYSKARTNDPTNTKHKGFFIYYKIL